MTEDYEAQMAADAVLDLAIDEMMDAEPRFTAAQLIAMHDIVIDATITYGGTKTERVCDVLMEALLAHPCAVDPLVSATLTTGELRVHFLLMPEAET